MNIFFLDNDPANAARMHCDKHVVKMVVESTQMLCTVLNEAGIVIPGAYKSTHAHHPCVLWASESPENFLWLLTLALNLDAQYAFRYKKCHKCHGLLIAISVYFNTHLKNHSMWKSQDFTTPPQCMPDEYRDEDAPTAYRQYYKGEKSKFAKWAHSGEPEWWN